MATATSTPVSEIMSGGAQFCMANDCVFDAAKKMADLHIGALPVCDGERLIGMVTDRDIVVKTIASGDDPKQVTLDTLCDGTPVVVGADETVDKAMRKMRDKAVRRLPVIDQNKKLVGMVSQGDIAMHMGETETGHLVEDISAAPDNN